MATQNIPFRFPTQDALDIELAEEITLRPGVPAGERTEAELAFGTPHPKCPEHRLVSQEVVPGRDAHSGNMVMRRTYRKLPGKALAGESVRAASWGAAAVTTVQDVPAGTPADTGLRVLESVVEPRDAQTARKKTTWVDWPVLVSHSTEPQTRTPMTTTQTMVAAGTPLPPETPLTIERKVTAVNQWRSVQSVTVLDALPAAYTETKQQTVRFPGLFLDFDTTGLVVFKRDAFSRAVQARVEVSFGYAQVQPAIMEFAPATWSFPSFSGHELLTDQEYFLYWVKEQNYFRQVPASTPSRSEYEAKVGTWVAIAGHCERWKGGVWRTEVVKVKLL